MELPWIVLGFHTVNENTSPSEVVFPSWPACYRVPIRVSQLLRQGKLTLNLQDVKRKEVPALYLMCFCAQIKGKDALARDGM